MPSLRERLKLGLRPKPPTLRPIDATDRDNTPSPASVSTQPSLPVTPTRAPSGRIVATPDPLQTPSFATPVDNNYGIPSPNFVPQALSPSPRENDNITEELWELAYDKIKTKHAKLAKTYEDLLWKQLGYNLTSLKMGWTQLQELLAAGLKKMETMAKAKTNAAPVLKVMDSVKNTVGTAVKNSQEAALAWSAVCILLQFIINVGDEAEAYRKGLDYVVERLEFNNRLARLRLDGIFTTPEELELQTQIKGQLVNLYQHILIYLLKSVCYNSRRTMTALLRDSLKLDSWDKLHQNVKDAEASLDKDDASFKAYKNTIHLKELLQIARDTEVRARSNEDNECLRQLRVTDPRDDKKRIERTKGGLLEDIYKWVLETSEFKSWRAEHKSLWVHGNAGKGKTMLLCGMIDELRSKSVSRPYQGPVAYFFCQADDPRINSADNVLRGLLYMLVDEHADLMHHVRTRFDKAGGDVFKDTNSWIALSEIFYDIVSNHEDICLVVDALDECVNGRDLLLDLIHSSTSQVRWIVSSRNWTEIEERIYPHSVDEISLELNAEAVSMAIETYINYKVDKLAVSRDLDLQKSDAIRKYLLKNATGTFLWVSLVCHNLEKISKPAIVAALHLFPPKLDPVYRQMLKGVERGDDQGLGMYMLGLITHAYRPLRLTELCKLLEIPAEIDEPDLYLTDIIKHSGFLALQESSSGPIVVLIHLSAKEFLLKAAAQCSTLAKAEIDCYICKQSMDIFGQVLRRNIYQINDWEYQVNSHNRPEYDPLLSITYSCLYWVQHFQDYHSACQQDSKLEKHHLPLLQTFLSEYLLHWIESLSLLGEVSRGLESMLKLKLGFSSASDNDDDFPKDIADFLFDAVRFFLYCFDMVSQYPLQLYASSLLLCPSTSLTRKKYEHEIPSWLEMQNTGQQWSTFVLSTFTGSWTQDQMSMDCSPNHQMIATRNGANIEIRSGTIGLVRVTIKTSGFIRSNVSFSPDGRYVAETANPKVVAIWRCSDGYLEERVDLAALCPEIIPDIKREQINALFPRSRFKYLPDAESTIHVSDCTVRIWNKSWEVLQTIVYSHPIVDFSCSSDGRLLSVHCVDEQVHVTKLAAGTEAWSTKASVSEDYRPALAFSPDGRHLITNKRGYIYIHDARTGLERAMLGGQRNRSFAMRNDHLACLSYDGRYISIYSLDGSLQKTINCENSTQQSIIYTSSWLVTLSHSGSTHAGSVIKMWNADEVQEEVAVPATSDGGAIDLNGLTLSVGGQHVGLSLRSGAVKIWDKNLRLKLISVEPRKPKQVCFSHDGPAMVDFWDEGPMQLWDINTSKVIEEVEHRAPLIRQNMTSAPGGIFAWKNSRGSVCVFNPSRLERVNVLVGGTGQRRYVLPSNKKVLDPSGIFVTGHPLIYQFCIGSSGYLATCGDEDDIVQLWDAEMVKQKTLKGLEGRIDGGIIAPKVHQNWLVSIAFSNDANQLAVAYPEDILVWDLAHETVKYRVPTSKPAVGLFFSARWNRFVSTDTRALTANNDEQMFIDTEWITIGSKRVVKRPVDHRQTRSLCWHDAVFLLLPDTNVTLVRIDYDEMKLAKW